MLFGTGFLLCFFRVFLTEYTALGFLILFLGMCVYVICSISRRITIIFSILGAAAAGFWVIALNGYQTLFDTVMAVVLHMSGAAGAVPVFAREVSVLASLVLTVIAFLCTSRDYGSAFQGSMLFTFLYIAWTLQMPFLLACLVPSVIASILMLGSGGAYSVRLRSLLPLAVLLSVVSL